MYLKKRRYMLFALFLSLFFISPKIVYANNIDEFICLDKEIQRYLNSIKKGIVNIDYNPGALMTLTLKDNSKVYIQPGAGCLVGVVKR